MPIINSEEAARRLARVILADIELYNSEKIRAGLDLRREINEGYKLFRARVAPELVSVFASAVSQKRFGGEPTPQVTAGPTPAAAPSWPRPVAVDPTSPQRPIETAEAAKRLAASVLLDVQATIGQVSDGDLRAEIDERRLRFKARVVPTLVPIFDEVLQDMGLGLAGTPAAALVAPAAHPAPLSRFSNPSARILLALALLLAAGTLVYFLLLP